MPSISDLEREFYMLKLSLEGTTLSNADLKKMWLEQELEVT